MPTYAEQRRPAGRFPAADLGGDRRPGRAAGRPGGSRRRAAARPSKRSTSDQPDDRTSVKNRWTSIMQPHPTMPPTASPPPAGASFFRWLTYGARRGRAAAVLGIPLVGYFFGPAKRRRVHWVALGPVDSFPPDETRLVTFDNPLRQPWDGMTAHTGVYVRNRRPGTDAARRPVPGPRRQLRPPGLPGVVVPAVGPVHVSLPRRRLLRQRRTRLRPAAARAVPLRLAGRGRPARDPGAALSDACRTRSEQSAEIA